MKHTTSLLRSSLALLAASALFHITPTLAQNGNAGAGAGGGGGQAGGPAGGPGGRRGGGPMANLSDEQREALRTLSQDTRELNTKLTEARKELNGAVYAETVNEASIREKSAAVAKIEADIAIARAKGFAKIRDKFTAEQIENLKNAPGFGGGFGGRGGGGGGQGGQGGGNRRPGGGTAQ